MQRPMLAIAAFVLAVWGGSVRAADEVVIGALYPMTGPNAQVGNDAKAAMETAAEIINGSHNVPMMLGKGGGLDKLGGAKVRLIFADHQGDPQKARAEAERLIRAPPRRRSRRSPTAMRCRICRRTIRRRASTSAG